MNTTTTNTETPILTLTIELYKELYGYIKFFPKRDQYMLGKRCEDTLLAFIEILAAALYSSGRTKQQYLIHAEKKFDLLKMLLRITWELHIIDNKKYFILVKKTQTIGKMIGGWKKSL